MFQPFSDKNNGGDSKFFKAGINSNCTITKFQFVQGANGSGGSLVVEVSKEGCRPIYHTYFCPFFGVDDRSKRNADNFMETLRLFLSGVGITNEQYKNLFEGFVVTEGDTEEQTHIRQFQYVVMGAETLFWSIYTGQEVSVILGYNIYKSAKNIQRELEKHQKCVWYVDFPNEAWFLGQYNGERITPWVIGEYNADINPSVKHFSFERPATILPDNNQGETQVEAAESEW